MTASVLVVDDMEPNRRLLQAKLEAKYYTVFMAADGPHALESALRHEPDIILLDVMMPGMDGYEVCRRLKASAATRHIPVVMLTALTDRDDRLRGLEAGADDFLCKPVDDFGLFARLEALMRYNMVANELRTRDSAGAREEHFSDFEQESLNKPASVLVIDQNNSEARRVAKSLEAVGHQAATWMDAQASSIRFDEIDIVIIALSDQNHDALKLCAHLRALKEARDFSMIVTCSVADQPKGVEALRIGASDLILTPLDMLELQARVRTQTRRKRFERLAKLGHGGFFDIRKCLAHKRCGHAGRRRIEQGLQPPVRHGEVHGSRRNRQRQAAWQDGFVDLCDNSGKQRIRPAAAQHTTFAHGTFALPQLGQFFFQSGKLAHPRLSPATLSV